MHMSIPVEGTVELIDKTEVSPLLDKCNIKVCWVGETPNRNHTVFSKDVAREMGRKIPGSPIVGFFNEQTKDFEGHNRDITIGNGSFKIVDTTRPYGFVPTDARVWFQKFRDDDGVEREYLCVEGYLWTKAYKEVQRILAEGNNQSMEVTEDKGFWTNDVKSGDRIFIYNEALVEKLCILGENVEPCFQGAQIKNQFSLAAADFKDFESKVYALIGELKDAIQGGLDRTMEDENKVVAPGAQEPADPNYAKQEDEKEKENTDSKGKDGKETTDKTEDKTEGKTEDRGNESEDKNKKKYNLDDVTEYQELKNQYADLESKYAELKGQYAALESQNAELTQFRNAAELKEKQAMVESFYMLSEEDKKDVLDNINTYSLEDIEAKLSIICVRNKVSFIKEGEEQEDAPATTFSLEAAAATANDNAPAWIQAVREYSK